MDEERRHFYVAAGQWNPWSNIATKDGKIDVEGPMGDVIKTLANILDFNYDIVDPSDGEWGGPLGNGSWSGMIGMILRDEAEFALGPFSLGLARGQVIDFTTVFFHGRESIVTSRPKAKNDIQGLLNPFTLQVWLLVLVSLMFISFSLSTIEKVEGRLYNIQKNGVTSEAVMWALKAFTQEGSEWLPKSNTGRIIVSVWVFSCLIVMSLYSGILTAMLTAPRVTIPVDSLEDLVSQKETPWNIASEYLNHYFKTSDIAVHRKAQSGALSNKVYSCWDVKESVARGDLYIICQDTEIKKMMSWDFGKTAACRMYKARTVVYANDLNAMVFKKNSSILQKSNRVLDSLKESGIFNYWLQQRLPNSTQCLRPPTSDQSDNEREPLNIEVMGGPFILLIGGYLTALMAFFIEEVYHHHVDMGGRETEVSSKFR